MSFVKDIGKPPMQSCESLLNQNFGKDPRYIYSLKNYDKPSKGCIDVNSISTQEADDLMASQKIVTKNATAVERRTLAAGIKRVQELAGGVFEMGKDPLDGVEGGYGWHFYDNVGFSSQRKDHVRISRKIDKRGEHKHYGLSVAQHVHEWAHLIGNQGAYSQFQKFMNSKNYGAKNYCMVSNYADNTHGEQFAEVFTAFVTQPEILLNNSRTPKNCKKVFEFFWGWFKNGHKVQSCM